MKIWRMVAGILSLIFSVIVKLEACGIGVVNLIKGDGLSESFAGSFCGLLLLIGGIISICFCDSTTKGRSQAIAWVFGVTAFLGLINGFVFWGIWALVNCGIAIYSIYKNGKAADVMVTASDVTNVVGSEEEIATPENESPNDSRVFEALPDEVPSDERLE